MKKILLIITLCLFSLNVNAKTPDDNVDTFYKNCQDVSLEKAYCYGYVRGYSIAIFSIRKALENISINCNPSNDELLERFFILYRRNTFEINGRVSKAIGETFLSLCPIITKEQFDKEWKDLKTL